MSWHLNRPSRLTGLGLIGSEDDEVSGTPLGAGVQGPGKISGLPIPCSISFPLVLVVLQKTMLMVMVVQMVLVVLVVLMRGMGEDEDGDEEPGEEDARLPPKTSNGRDQSTFDSNPFGVTRCVESGCPSAESGGRPFNGVYNLCKHLRGHESKKKVDEKKYSKHKIVRCTECSIITNEISGHLKRYCKKLQMAHFPQDELANSKYEAADSIYNF